jgi:hypothetical protein
MNLRVAHIRVRTAPNLHLPVLHDVWQHIHTSGTTAPVHLSSNTTGAQQHDGRQCDIAPLTPSIESRRPVGEESRRPGELAPELTFFVRVKPVLESPPRPALDSALPHSFVDACAPTRTQPSAHSSMTVAVDLRWHLGAADSVTQAMHSCNGHGANLRASTAGVVDTGRVRVGAWNCAEAVASARARFRQSLNDFSDGEL